MFNQLSSAPSNPLPAIRNSNPCLFCNASNLSAATSSEECEALTLPTWDNNTKRKIKWTTFSLHKDHAPEAKRCTFYAWDSAMEYARSVDRIALFATNDKSKIDLGSKTWDQSNDKQSKHGKDCTPYAESQVDTKTILFVRLLGGEKKRCNIPHCVARTTP